MAARAKRAGVVRKEVDLNELVKQGPTQAYEALQLYRSRALRFKTKNDLKGAICAAAQGALSLLKNAYMNAGAGKITRTST